MFVALMVGAAYAAVPFYNWFCRTAGYGGTTQRAHAAPAQTNERTITVYFDSNIAAGLPWDEINILRAYAKYLRRTGFALSQAFIESTLAARWGWHLWIYATK